MSAAQAPAALAEGCQYVLGFATLDNMVPKIVGQCVDNQSFDPTTGDAVQHTSNGLLVWRKADNFTAFTDGYRSWVNGPKGLEARLNSQRFSWEANPGSLTVVPDAYVGQQTLQVVSSTLSFVGAAPLRFTVQGSGFVPGVPVTLQGTYTPAYLVRTNNPQTPYVEHACSQQAVNPVQVVPDSHAAFTATLTTQNAHTGGHYSLTANSPYGSASLSGSGQANRVSVLPSDCH